MRRLYRNYSQFIYSMLDVNIINKNIVVAKGKEPATALFRDDRAGLESICQEIQSGYFDKDVDDYLSDSIASVLDLSKDKIIDGVKRVSGDSDLFGGAILFDKSTDLSKGVSVVGNPLNDSWYLMVREYMELQASFYKIKKEVYKVIKILDALPDTEKEVAILKGDIFDVDSLYRKLDEVVRYNVIDLPVSIYADLYYIELKKGKKWYNDNEENISDIAISYNKSCANMQKYMVSEFAINRVMKVTRALKKEFSEEGWGEVKAKAKLTQDWFNMLNKIQISNK